jgi:ligand-binding sensor domain-containing protein
MRIPECNTTVPNSSTKAFLNFIRNNRTHLQSFVVLLFLLICTPNILFAQLDISKKTFTTDNGLAHNFVQHISQDQTGFLWISTWDGLSRFDGHQFKNYYHKPNDTTTFPFFIVEKTHVDKNNTVWVICPQRQLVTYNRKNDNFTEFKPNGHKTFTISDVVSGYGFDLWMINELENNLYRYNIQTKEMETFKISFSNQIQTNLTPFLPKLIFDNLGNIWIICIYKGVNKIYKTSFENEGQVQLKELNSLPAHFFEPDTEIRRHVVFDINVSDSGKTWFFTNFGLFYVEPNKNNLIEYEHQNSPFNLTGKPNYYWSGKKTGITILNTKTNELLNIKTDPEKHVSSIYIDSQNNIWSGSIVETYGHIGLTRYSKIPNLFKHYLTGKNDFGNNHLVFPIVKDKNKDIWVGTRGLDYIFKITPEGEAIKTEITEGFEGTRHPKAKTMVEDSLGIWMGCTENFISHYNYAEQNFTPFLLKADSCQTEVNIHNILKRGNEIVINGFSSIYTYNINSDSLFWRITPYPGYAIFCMVSDGTNGYWLGSSNSTIIHLDNQFHETGRYQIGNGGTNVEHICMGDNNDVWIALMGGGLGHLLLESETYEIITSADGLSNNTTYSILKDKRGNLWISTNIGISRFNPSTKHFRNFGKTDGLLIEEFNSDAWYQAEDGELFFGGVGGLISFYPDSIEKQIATKNTDRLIITEFNVSGIPRFFERAIYEMDTVTLAKGDNNFQLSYANLNFQNSDKLKYRYRICNKDSNWIEADSRNRNINYANLLPGKYKLKIESTNSSGEWNSTVGILIIIPSYYYQTIGFKLLIVFFTIGIIILFFIIYTRQIRQDAKQKQDALRLESLRGQMNPHFIFNSLNSINYFISNNDKISANHYIADFSRLIRAFLTNLSKEYIPFDDEIKMLEDYLKLEHLRFSDKFDYVLNSDKIENQNDIFVFPGMVQPFIENAIWHGVRNLENKKGFIRIEFQEISSNIIRCTIEDNGIGRKQARLLMNKLPGKKSRGIGIVMERLNIISKILKADYQLSIQDLYADMEDAGTIVIIDLPKKPHVE